MKNLTAITFLLFAIEFCNAQNVGIGTTTPTGPLSFSGAVGNKIVLWGDGATNHYGIGIQGGLLQLYANQPSDAIAFGIGRSNAFVERARIVNSGLEGMYLNGRLHLKNGDPTNLSGAGGVWLYKPDNSALLGFMGAQNSQNIGFYGGPIGWGFTYDAINSRVGIGNNNPNAPLAFGAVGGKKITLYPGGVGDAGFGIAPNRLQIYSDNPNADVAIGYDAAGVFNERFSVKPNGALAASGNTGTSLQVLSSNGSGAGAQWRGMYDMLGRNIMQPFYESGSLFLLNDESVQNSIPFQFNLATPSSVILYGPVRLSKTCAIYPCFSSIRVRVSVDNAEKADWTYTGVSLFYSGSATNDHESAGPVVFDLAAGAHTLTYTVQSLQGAVSCNVKPQLFIVSK